MYQNKYFLPSLLLLLCGLTSPIFAQGNFTTIQEGDYETVYKTGNAPSNLTLHGSYEASFVTPKNGFTGSRSSKSEVNQEMILHFRSSFNEHVSINAYISNLKTDISTQRYGYGSERSDEWGESRDADGMNLYFKESYLEYNNNPSSVLKIGRQKASLGDEQGLIYEGYGNGITQKCRMGTWCYYVGAIQLGDKEADSLFFAELNYPVYQTGVLVDDPWEGERQKSSLDIEFIRAIYSGTKIPMNNQGTWAAEGSGRQATTDDGDSVYFDNKTVEYVGMNIKWNYDRLQTKFFITSVGGHRDFYSKDAATGEYTHLGNKGQGGLMTMTSLDYRYEDRWKVRLQNFQSSGTELSSATEKYWERDSTGYQEIQKGYFGDAIVYLNGIGLSGDGHSAQNLIYNRLGVSFVNGIKDYSFDMDFYEFKRAKSVFNENGDRVKNIGRELDVTFTWALESNLHAKGFGGFFRGGGAYSESDITAPTAKAQADFSRWGASILYKF